jgi:hypothetical protein
LELLLENCTGSAIGDSGYISRGKSDRLMKKNLKFIARKRKNMKVQNSEEERRRLKNAVA